MLKDCWPSLRSSWQNATFDSILRRWALVYLPTVCVVSVFVALTWLGLSMNNSTFRDKDLVVVITYFAALLVLECILLSHVAIRRQRTTRLSPKLLCVEASTETMSSGANANVARPKPATSTAENLDQAQYQPRPQVLHALPTQVTAERLREPVPHSEQPTPSASSSHPIGPLPSQRVPALCEPVNSSPTHETNRPLTAATYIPEPSLPVLPPTPDHPSSWNPSMANNHQSRLAVSPPSSPPPPRPALLQAEAPMKPSSAAPPAPAPTVPPERRATPHIPETKPLKIHTQISAVPSTAPPARKSRPMYRATGAVEEHERQQPQPQPQPHSPGAPQVQSQVQPQSRSHSSLLQKNLIALAGT
jgi:hypothetical protein